MTGVGAAWAVAAATTTNSSRWVGACLGSGWQPLWEGWMQGWRGERGRWRTPPACRPTPAPRPPRRRRVRVLQTAAGRPPLLVALAYRAQLVGEVPVEPHDARVDAIVTADEAIVCTPAGAAALAPA